MSNSTIPKRPTNEQIVADDISFARHSLMKHTLRWADNDRLRGVHLHLLNAITSFDEALEELEYYYEVKGRWS